MLTPVVGSGSRKDTTPTSAPLFFARAKNDPAAASSFSVMSVAAVFMSVCGFV